MHQSEGKIITNFINAGTLLSFIIWALLAFQNYLIPTECKMQ